MRFKMLREFMQYEASAGVLLFLAAVFALVLSNSPLLPHYERFLDIPFSIHLGLLSLSKPLLLWVNDGLMAVFFLLVGLEIKREMLEGELNSTKKALLPGIAAIGGIAFPVCVFLLFTHHHPEWRAGWAIPAATDIAFSLGVLGLLGKRVPASLKIFLTAVAIFDDIGAILIIALFYTAKLSMIVLPGIAFCMIVLFILNRLRVSSALPYVLIGVLLWICVLKSGVHATLAGIILAWAIPLKGKKEGSSAPLEKWEKKLHPWVAYAVLPIFAFANAGVHVSGLNAAEITNPLVLGCVFGLLLGKPVGIWGLTMLSVKSGIAKLPRGVNAHSLFGMSLLAGIGFTMSLFIGSLAFYKVSPSLYNYVQIGVFAGSLFAGMLGYFFLKKVALKRKMLS